jgi:hypothetical protein
MIPDVAWLIGILILRSVPVFLLGVFVGFLVHHRLTTWD